MALDNVQAVMEAIASTLNGVNPDYRADPYPADAITAPATVVGYPDIDFDSTFARGADEATFPVYFAVGTTSDRSAMERIAAIVAGTGTIKNALDGNLGGAVASSRVASMRVLRVDLAGVNYLCARFAVEVIR